MILSSGCEAPQLIHTYNILVRRPYIACIWHMAACLTDRWRVPRRVACWRTVALNATRDSQSVRQNVSNPFRSLSWKSSNKFSDTLLRHSWTPSTCHAPCALFSEILQIFVARVGGGVSVARTKPIAFNAFSLRSPRSRDNRRMLCDTPCTTPQQQQQEEPTKEL